MEAVADSAKTESRLRHRRGRPAADKTSVSLFYNPDRWTSLSIDKHTVGPMGVLELAGDYGDDPRIAEFRRRGQLVALKDMPDLPYGALLLTRFDEQGARGEIVVSRTYAYGDILLALIVLELLLFRYPNNRIIFHTDERMEPLVRYYPGVDIIVGKDRLQKALRTAGVFLNLDDVPELFEERNPGAGLNRIEIFADYLGMTPMTLSPSYYITKEEIEGLGNYAKKFESPFIGISPSTMRTEKTWRPERWESLALKLIEETNGTVFVFDSENVLECQHPKIVPFINKSLRAAGAMGWYMDLFVTHDSLWSHWAAALGVPQVLLASCTDGRLLSKGYPGVAVIQRDWPCVPCWYKFDNGDCIYGNYPKCLDDVNVEEVCGVTMEALNDGKRERKS